MLEGSSQSIFWLKILMDYATVVKSSNLDWNFRLMHVENSLYHMHLGSFCPWKMKQLPAGAVLGYKFIKCAIVKLSLYISREIKNGALMLKDSQVVFARWEN